MEIEFLHNSKINIGKWDRAIRESVNSRVYAESWYLDIVAPDWFGLILDNYRYVMPLVCNKKLGFKYAFQPVYTQQHGIFPPASAEITSAFLEKLNSLFSFYELCFNSLNIIEAAAGELVQRKNYLLNLDSDYTGLFQKYNTHAKRHVRKSKKLCTVSESVSCKQYIDLKTKFAHKGIASKHIKTLTLIINQSLLKGRGQLLGAYDAHNELCAAAFFLKENKRTIYLNSVSSPEGKSNRAMYGIVDHFIEQNAGTKHFVDFEGSNIEGIARFFEGFGASPEFYSLLKHNSLNWPFNYLKK